MQWKNKTYLYLTRPGQKHLCAISNQSFIAFPLEKRFQFLARAIAINTQKRLQIFYQGFATLFLSLFVLLYTVRIEIVYISLVQFDCLVVQFKFKLTNAVAVLDELVFSVHTRNIFFRRKTEIFLHMKENLKNLFIKKTIQFLKLIYR